MKHFISESKLRIGSIFSGIGAMEEALFQMNISTEIEFACDNDVSSYQTYLLNWPHVKRFYDDVFTIRESRVKYDLDILLLSPPCVEFSKINFQRDLKSDTANLIYEPLRLIKDSIINAKVILFENVDNLLTIDNGQSFKNMLDVMKSLNYNVSYRLVNANLFSATNRNRLFVVLTRKDIKEYEWSNLPDKLNHKVIKDYLQDTKSSYLDIYKPFTRTNTPVSKSGINKIATIDTIKFAQRAIVYDVNHKVGTINATDIVNVLCENKIRKLSTIEKLTIMGFRKEFKINHLSERQATNKIGNSIQIDVLRYLIKPMMIVLKHTV